MGDGEGGGGGGDSPVSGSFLQPTEKETFTLTSGRQVEAAANEVLVYLDEDVTDSEYRSVVSSITAMGGTVVSFNVDLRVIQVRVANETDEVTLAANLESAAGVRASGLNEVVVPSVMFTADENLEGYQYYLPLQGNKADNEVFSKAVARPTQLTPFEGHYWIEHIGAENAWDEAAKLELASTTIGIVDTGLPADQGVIDETRIIDRFDEHGNTIDGDDTFDIPIVGHHGLWVTAFAAGNIGSDSDIVRGVNPYAEVVFVDIFRRRTGPISGPLCSIPGLPRLVECAFFTDVLAGTRTAIRLGSDVVNVSMAPGNIECIDSQDDRLDALRRFRNTWGNAAVDFAKRMGALVVYSSNNICEKMDHQLLLQDEDVLEDAWLSHSLIVGASTDERKDACFSVMGKVVNLMAPGQDVGWGNGETANGTSFAAPMVAGAAALIHSVNGGLRAPEIRFILIDDENTSSITYASTAENRSDTTCSGDDAPPLVESTWRAVMPNRLLNVARAVESAKLTRGVPLQKHHEVISLNRGDTRDVILSLTLPETGVTSLDLLLLIDQSGSYGDDISTLKNQAIDIITDLNSRGIDVQFGIAGFSDFPLSSYGYLFAGDEAFYLHQPITNNMEAVQTAINGLSIHNGGDGSESQYEALYQAVTGAGRDVDRDGDYTDTGDITPSVLGWRTGSLKVILLATDAEFHDSDEEPDYPGAGAIETLAALEEADAIVFGLQSGGAVSDLLKVVEARKGTNYPLDAASSGIATAISNALDTAVAELDVTLETVAGDEWVDGILPAGGYPNVTRGSTVDFTVSLKGQRDNSICIDLHYSVYLWARGDGSALLGRYEIPIVVFGTTSESCP